MDRWDEATHTLSRPMVTLAEVSDAISRVNGELGRSLSTKNPANFVKDFIRNRQSANTNWPSEIWRRGYTIQQATGSGDCFRFVDAAGLSEPFPALGVSGPTPQTPVHHMESVSLPLASRKLGRNDEPWMIQVIARLRIVETHFSLYSPRKANVRQIDLLQMNVKLSKTEIDALFLLQELDTSNSIREVMVTCEAKGGRDDILPSQILAQAKAPFTMKGSDAQLVVPIAVKCVGPSQVHLVEFEQVTRSTYEAVEALMVVADSLFVIEPSVPGICD